MQFLDYKFTGYDSRDDIYLFKVNNKNLRRTSSLLTLNKFLFVIISAKTSEELQKVCVSSSEKIEKEDYH